MWNEKSEQREGEITVKNKRGRRRMDEGERKLRRLAQNRVSAGKARVKKKSEILEIQRERDDALRGVEEGEKRNEKMMQRYEKERMENQRLKERIRELECEKESMEELCFRGFEDFIEKIYQEIYFIMKLFDFVKFA